MTRFGWLWASYAVSTFGTWLAFDAFTLIAILVLHAGPVQVSLLAAVGTAAGAVLALPLGPWIEHRRKRSVMIGTDLLRCAALLSVAAAFAFGLLGFTQLLIVSVVVAAADIAFVAASGAYVKWLVKPEDLLVANGRFESTMWTATALGPPLGGALIGAFGPITTVVLDAGTYLLSALGLRAIKAREPRPSLPRTRPAWSDLLDGLRHIMGDPELKPLFLNQIAVNALIMATAPPLAVLMLGDLGFTPLQYGLAFAVPCLGGLVGSRWSRRLVARHGADRVLRLFGVLRACWPLALAFVGPGIVGLVFVMVVEFGLITCMGVHNPILATRRQERTPDGLVARVLSTWSVGSKISIAVLTALWGVIAGVGGPRLSLLIAGVLLLLTPLLLVSRVRQNA
ncbi:MFS transporter [Saccharothrix violaceirubra]|uniref:MFS family permease n=1 Tax=Saccharothrix violaceirubra TaxID=413306 RepID=A0A7W7TA26_9PSEU|nr:MFS transporter [Saccharothrix violaceirubra]MBB4969295.1 MFS family permease [Saccharothrix violaceirubra]